MKKGIFVLFLLLKICLQAIAIHPVYDLHRDEFLHLDQADHLAWGYLSVPPFTSWIAYLIQALGGGEFWVRFFPAFFGVLLMGVIWDLVKRLGGGLFAQSLAMVALLFSALIRLNILFQPNSVDILCFTLVFYFLIRYKQTLQNYFLYLMGLSFAIGFLNKYTVVFLALGLALALLFSWRSLWKNKHFFLALLLAFFLVLPNLNWQFQNNWPVLVHMRLLSQYQLVNNSKTGFLLEQFLFFYPSMLLWVGGLIYAISAKSTSQYRFVPLTYLFTIGLFTFFQAKGYYALGLYPVLIAFGVIWIEKNLERLRQRLRLAAIILFLGIPVLLFLPAFRLIHPFYSPEEILNQSPDYALLGLNTWEDGLEHPIPQDFADMLAWQELVNLVDSAYFQMPEGRTFVLCDNYGQAGAINFYSENPKIKAFSMDADYLFWMDLTEPIDNVILVYEKAEELSPEVISGFEEYRKIGEIKSNLAREKGTTVHLLKNAKVDVNQVIKKELEEEKKIWTEF